MSHDDDLRVFYQLSARGQITHYVHDPRVGKPLPRVHSVHSTLTLFDARRLPLHPFSEVTGLFAETDAAQAAKAIAVYRAWTNRPAASASPGRHPRPAGERKPPPAVLHPPAEPRRQPSARGRTPSRDDGRRKKREAEARDGRAREQKAVDAATAFYRGLGPEADLRVFRVLDGLITRSVLVSPGARPAHGDGFCCFQHPGGIRYVRGVWPEAPGARRASGPDTRALCERFREWQSGARERAARDEEEKRRREFDAEVQRLITRARESVAEPVASTVTRDAMRPLRFSDVRLAVQWCSRFPDARAYQHLLRAVSGPEPWMWQWLPFEEGCAPGLIRLLELQMSARIAELAVACFYAEHDPALPATDPIVDMSGLQEADAARFTPDYDLGYRSAAGGRRRYLDVKNARGTEPGSGRPQLKRFKTTGPRVPVTIVGTQSAGRGLRALLNPADPRGEAITVLGEVDNRTVARLKRRYGTVPWLSLSIARLDDRDQEVRMFVPPWMFTAPDFITRPRRRALRSLRRAVRDGGDARIPAALALAAGIPVHAAVLDGLTPWQRYAARTLEARPGRERRYLPDLYLFLLEQFIQHLKLPPAGAPPYAPREYAEVLFAGSRTAPLGLADPTESVDGLLRVLETLAGQWKTVSCFDTFRFEGDRLYGALHDSGKWWTLMFPYCDGGCGHPLVLSDATPLCGRCRRLRCPRCKSCLKGVGGRRDCEFRPFSPGFAAGA